MYKHIQPSNVAHMTHKLNTWNQQTIQIISYLMFEVQGILQVDENPKGGWKS